MKSDTPDDIRALARFMQEHDLEEAELRQNGVRIHLRRGNASPERSAEVRAAEGTVAGDEIPPGTVALLSPMTGIFYRSPAPDRPPFVVEGDIANEGDTVGLIEAMKVFNEILAEVSGRVVKILVANEAHVEENEPLMYLEPIEP